MDPHIVADNNEFLFSNPALGPTVDSKGFADRIGAMANSPSYGVRGDANFLEFDSIRCAIKHYRRGGVAACLSTDRYLWLGLRRTRVWREWTMLTRLAAVSLPVPVPVAARVQRFQWNYAAQLITKRIEHSLTLAQYLVKHDDSDIWARVGWTIRQFHDHGAFHADLNAKNIMVDSGRNIYILDFDRGKFRVPCILWKKANLKRLQQSLEKIQRAHRAMHFCAENWRQLVQAYQHNGAPR